MASVDIQWTVVEEINRRLAAHPLMAGVVVADGYPGDKAERPEMIWPDDLAGDVTLPVATAGRRVRDDRFTVSFLVKVTGRRTLRTTHQRLAEIIGAVEDVLADASDLDDMDGVISVEVASKRRQAQQSQKGPVGFAEVVVSAHTRLI